MKHPTLFNLEKDNISDVEIRNVGRNYRNIACAQRGLHARAVNAKPSYATLGEDVSDDSAKMHSEKRAPDEIDDRTVWNKR